MARRFNLSPGMTLALTPYGAHTRKLVLRIIGIWSPRDPGETFWLGRSFTAEAGGPGSTPTYPLLVTRDTALAAGARLNVGGTENWGFVLDPARVTVTDSADVAQRAAAFRSRAQDSVGSLIGAQGLSVATDLDTLLAGFAQQRDAILLPLYIVAAQVLGLILFYVVSMASMLVTQQGPALAVMRSRGTARGQILLTYALQALLVCVVAVAAGPWLAITLSGRLIALLMGGSVAGWQPPVGAALLAAAVAGLLGLGVTLVATLSAARRDILAFRREAARVSRPPLWQRLYLDVVLALLCAAGYYELGQSGGSPVTSSTPDILLLLAPGLLLLAGALLLARVFPLGARLGGLLAARGKGAPVLLALLQIARTPGRYVRLVLLVTLAVSLGLFTLVFSSSLDQRVSDRAAYTSGADLRAVLSAGADPRVPSRIAQLPGVTAATFVTRTQVQLPLGEGSRPVNLLAVDTGTFARVAAWRDDYASVPLADLLKTMSASSSTTGGTLWALADAGFLGRTHAHVGDTIDLTPTESPGTTLHVRIGAEVSAFPTLEPDPDTGFLVLDLAAYNGALQATDPSASQTATEVWLATSSSSSALTALHQALLDPTLTVTSAYDRRALLAAGQHNPLTVGLRGMLLLGVAAALGLALVGTVVGSIFDARQRTIQFATLRALGASARQVLQLLLTEEGAVYALGLLAGTLLGLVASAATLPLLAYAGVASGTSGGPPYALVAAPGALALFYGVVLVGAAGALAASAA
jgi:putative ABC transport system permease protein